MITGAWPEASPPFAWPAAPRRLARTAAGAGVRTAFVSRGELLHVMLEEPLRLAVDRHEHSKEVEEVLPFGVAVAHGPCVGALVDRMVRIDDVRPAVALGEQQHVAIAAHPHVGF